MPERGSRAGEHFHVAGRKIAIRHLAIQRGTLNAEHSCAETLDAGACRRAGGTDCAEIITRADGAETNLHLPAAFDGEKFPMEGSGAIETMADARPEPNTILGTGKKGGAVCLIETVTVDAASGTRTQR
jgi:hypothetical protein